MRRFGPVIGSIALGVAAAFAGAGLDRPAAKPTIDLSTTRSPLVKSVLKNWDAIDRNHDGVITVAEIDRAVTDSSFTGDDAAAVAALKLATVNKSFVVPRLTPEYFVAYDRRVPQHAAAATTQSAESATVDPQTAIVPHITGAGFNWDLYYSASQKRISTGGTDRWTGRFDLDRMKQGPLGDCYFVAAVGSLQIHDRDRLSKMMTPGDNGHVRVAFGNGRSVDVIPPTDAELAISSTTAGDGVWLAYLEQAFGRDRSTQKGGPDDIDGTDLIRNGGDSAQSIGVLTGHRVRRITLARTSAQRKSVAGAALPELRKQLLATITNHKIVTAGVNPPDPETNPDPAGKNGLGTPPPLPPDITKHHVYAVVSFEESTDQIEIWNPHGQTFKPMGTPGLANGYVTDHGRFKLPLAEAYQFFTSFTFETGQALVVTKRP